MIRLGRLCISISSPQLFATVGFHTNMLRVEFQVALNQAPIQHKRMTLFQKVEFVAARFVLLDVLSLLADEKAKNKEDGSSRTLMLLSEGNLQSVSLSMIVLGFTK